MSREFDEDDEIEPKLDEGGALVYPCRHGFKTWTACASCCADIAMMVPPLMREVQSLEKKLKEKVKKARRRKPKPKEMKNSINITKEEWDRAYARFR